MIGRVSAVARVVSSSAYSGDMRQRQNSNTKQENKPRKSFNESLEDAFLLPPTSYKVNIRV